MGILVFVIFYDIIYTTMDTYLHMTFHTLEVCFQGKFIEMAVPDEKIDALAVFLDVAKSSSLEWFYHISSVE